MSLVAIIPVESMSSANDLLEAAGYGRNCFSVPCYTGAGCTHGAFHAWDNPDLFALVKSFPEVVWEESDGPPPDRFRALVEAQNAKWGAQAPQLPDTGTVTAGDLYQYEDSLWSIIQTFNRTTFNQPPETYPALCRRVRNPYALEPWRQPIDQYDAYKLVNPFTGNPDRCTYNGQTWEVTQADGAGNNLWQPGVFGWQVVSE